MMQPTARRGELCTPGTHKQQQKDRPVSDERLEKIAVEMAGFNGRLGSFEKGVDEIKEWLKELSRGYAKMATLEERIAHYQESISQLHLTIAKHQERQSEMDSRINELLAKNADKNIDTAKATTRTDDRSLMLERAFWIAVTAFCSGIVGVVVYQMTTGQT